MVTWGDVKQWQAAPLGAAGDGLKGDLDALEASNDEVRGQAVPDSWLGLASLLAKARQAALVQQMEAHVAGARAMQAAIYDTEGQVTEIERLVADVEGQAKAGQLTIAADGSVSDTSTPPTFDSRFEAEEWSDSRRTAMEAVAHEITLILGKAAAADATLSRGIPDGAVDTIDERGTPSPETAEAWANLTDAERQAVIEEMVEEQAAASGIDPPPDVVFEDLGNTNGVSRNGEIAININKLDDPDILHTVAHEMRHERQQQAIDDADTNFAERALINAGIKEDPFDKHEEDGITREQADDWEENSENYVSPEEDYEGYYNQPVEKDARNTGRDYLNDLTPEELERLQREAR